ncbi:MAG TPA: hypothetical protein GX504_01890 [Clostridia bacterium]|nr:hypothetical protein [Clostridia bacterium]
MIGITGAWQFPSAGSGRDGFSCLGAAGFSPGAAEHTILKVYNGVPYLAFVDVANGYRATVMFYHKKKRRWLSLGEPGFSKIPVNYTSMFIDNGVPYVAFKERMLNSKVLVMKYSGGAWRRVGGPVFCGVEINYLTIFVEAGVPYVAFTEGETYRGRVMKYDAKAGWVPVGGSFSDKFAGYLSLFVDRGTPYVAFTEGDDIPWCTLGKLAVARWEQGSAGGEAAWVRVGEQDIFGTAFYASLYVEQGVPYVAYGDGNELCKFSVAKCVYDEERGLERWIPVGRPGFSEGIVVYPKLVFDRGIPYVAFRDDTNGYGATVMKYERDCWVYVGEPGFSAGEVNYVSLQVEKGQVFVAYADGSRSAVDVLAAFFDGD